ncbi:MAG: Grx4 family monothiol glutaredoxin [Gammaproteobacteria bacterium]|nr:Grx4 family monothiol glutaredoxin [Gammaproteobacteria bacterium]
MNTETQERIESLITANKVVLFMKGTPEMPQCGFSAATIGVLNSLVEDYSTVNVLADQEVREGIKSFSQWPTIPQLYIDGEFVGGCDIVREMFNTGELHETLGMAAPDRTPPEIELSDAAAKVIREALQSQPGMGVHLQIDAQWEHNLRLGPVEGHEIKAESNSIVLHMDIGTGPRAQGVRIDMEESITGYSIKVENPNAPVEA